MVSRARYPYLGYRLYVVLHTKERRRMACLVRPGSRERTTISYARYLLSVRLRRLLGPDETVDHINGDSLDDRVANYQILSRAENAKKSAKGQTYFVFICPVCGVSFTRTAQRVHKGRPCCSRRCGGIKGRWGSSLVAQSSDLISRGSGVRLPSAPL